MAFFSSNFEVRCLALGAPETKNFGVWQTTASGHAPSIELILEFIWFLLLLITYRQVIFSSIKWCNESNATAANASATGGILLFLIFTGGLGAFEI
jgi:hypothetical protein